MKPLLTAATTIVLALTATVSAKETNESLNLAAMIQPVAADGIYTEPGYATWDGHLFKEDGKYFLIYSRWKTKGGDWMKTSEICIAASDKLDGPYSHKKVLLKGRGPGHWDELTAHNAKLEKYGDKYYLYYISSRSGETRGHIRDSQRIGVAMANSLMGPYERLDKPIVEPRPPVHNITVNPGVVQGPDGRFVMMLKGDKKPKLPTERMGQRVQGIALADSPSGPFEIQPKLAIEDIDTEDASVWYDARYSAFFAIYHAHSFVGVITSPDGIHWKPAAHPVVLKLEVPLANGSIMRLLCHERPFVFYEDGKPAALCISVRRGASYNTGSCMIIPLKGDGGPGNPQDRK
jgi:hypothetical protein